MVLTVAQTLSFFENSNQMAIPHATALQIVNEIIVTVGDLSDFGKDMISQIDDNLRRPGSRVANPAIVAVAGATIPTPPFVFVAKS